MRLAEGDATVRIECFCSRRPLLATAGRDRRTRRSFVWIKHTKNGKVLVEVVVTTGTVHLTCRECLRVHTVTVLPNDSKIFEREELIRHS